MEKEFSYEEATKRLEQIVTSLESGNLPMEEAIKIFDEGKELVKKCFASLESAKGKLSEVKEQLGKLIEE